MQPNGLWYGVCGSSKRCLYSLHQLFLQSTDEYNSLRHACTIPFVSWRFYSFFNLSTIRDEKYFTPIFIHSSSTAKFGE